MKFKFIFISILILTDFYFSTLLSSKLFVPVVLLLILLYSKRDGIPLKLIRVLFLVLLFISIQFFALDIGNIQFLSELIPLLGVVFLFFTLDSNKNIMNELIKYLFHISIFLGLVSLIFYISGKSFLPHEIISSQKYFVRFSIAIPVIFLPIFFIYFREHKYFKIFLLQVAIITLFSNWRAIQIAFLINITFIILRQKARKRLIYFMAIGGFLLFASITSQEFRITDFIFNPEHHKDITSGRLNIWEKSIVSFNESNSFEKIIGQGIGQFATAINKVSIGATNYKVLDYNYESLNLKGKDSRIHAHNYFFNILIEYGVIGLIIFTLFIYYIIRHIGKNHNNLNKSSFYFSLFALLISGIFTSVAYFTQPNLVLLLIIVKQDLYNDI